MEVLQANEILLDASRTDKAVENVDTSGFVVRSATTGASEGLLTYDCTSALLVVIHVSCCVSESVGGIDQGLPVL